MSDGTAVVESVLGQKATLDELGGTVVHGSKSGVAHVVCQDERSCLDSIRRLLSCLPQNCSQEASREISSMWESGAWDALGGKKIKKIAARHFEDIVPDNSRRAYDVHEVITNILENDSFYELHESFA